MYSRFFLSDSVGELKQREEVYKMPAEPAIRGTRRSAASGTDQKAGQGWKKPRAKGCATWHAKGDTDYLPGVLLVQVPLPLPRYFANEQACGRNPAS